MDADLNAPGQRSWEKSVIARAARGDKEAFGEIYDAHAERLYRNVLYPLLGNRAAAEDALAETFRAAFQRVGDYRPGEVSIYFCPPRTAPQRSSANEPSASWPNRSVASSIAIPTSPPWPRTAMTLGGAAAKQPSG